MRLTNEMRADFADRVMRKIPLRSTTTRDKVLDEIERRIMAQQPADVRKFVKDHPGHVERISQRVDWLDYRDHDAGHFHYGYVRGFWDTVINTIDLSDLKAAWEDHLAEQQERRTMRARILEQAGGCTTTQQLEVVFPDLKGLIPKPDVVVKSLPVAAKGLTDDLVKLGLEIPQ